MSFPKYEAYKDSGVEWLGEVPEHWGISRNKRVFNIVSKTVGKKSTEFQLLSLTLRGVIPRDIDSGKGKFPAEFDTYQIVEPGNIVFCLFDIDETPRTVGLSSNSGMITGAYTVATALSYADPRFIYYYYFNIDLRKGLRPFYTGLRKVVRPETFMNIEMPLPPQAEQIQISNFLDHETARIDALIAEQQRLIELLKEKRQAVISHAVTKGLDPTAPMKDSGVEWLGQVPVHWDVMQFKFATNLMQTGPFGSQLHAEDYIENGIPLINPAHIIEGQIVPDQNVSVDEKTKERLPRHHLKESDLILARRGELGRCAVVRQQHSGWLCGSGSMRVELSEKLMSDYTYLLISSEGVKAELSVTSNNTPDSFSG